MGPSNTQGASMRSILSAAMKVRVRQCPCGALPMRRSPLRHQPRVGAMLVLTQVSSMNTRRVASILCWCPFQRARLRTTSGRSCSAARRLFFVAQILAVQEGPNRAIAGCDTVLGELRLQRPDGDMRLERDPLQDEG